MPITRRLLGRQAATSLVGRTRDDVITYDTPGMTLVPDEVPEGFGEQSVSRVIGTGEDVYRTVGEAVMHWGLPIEAGFEVKALHASVVLDDRVAVCVPMGPLGFVGAGVVVFVTATGRSVGYGFGTLPGHPVRGEEMVLLTHQEDDDVLLTVRSISAPAARYAKLAGPLGRGRQRKAMTKYLDAAERIARGTNKVPSLTPKATRTSI